MPGDIHAVTMPKLGFAMKEGSVTAWRVAEGEPVSLDQAVADIEIEKAVAEVAAPAAGVLRRQVAAVGETLPVGGLIGVIAGTDATAEEIDRFVSEFRPAPLA